MPTIKGYFEYEDGLTPGRSKDGAIHHNLYDNGRLAGHGKFVPDEEVASAEDYGGGSHVADEDDTDLGADLFATATLLGGIVAWEVSKPYVKEYWNKHGRRSVRAARDRVFRVREPLAGPEVGEPISTTDVSSLKSSQETVTAPKEEKVALNRSEAQALLIAALRARSFSDSTIDMLRRATIVDEKGDFVPPRELASVSRQRIESTVQQGLEASRVQGQEALAQLRVKLERVRVRKNRAQA